MSSELIDAPLSGTDTATNLDDRTSTLHSYIIANSLELTELVHKAGKGKLFYDAPESILANLARNLYRYAGPTEETSFLHWARRYVAKEGSSWEITQRILTEYDTLLHAAIKECLWTSAVDCAIDPHQDIFWEVALLIYQRAHSFNRRGRAKLSTRLWALVKTHVYKYHNSKNAKRLQAVRLRQNELRCEHFSEEEIAAMKTTEREGSLYDPGYAEAGLSQG